MTLDIIFVQLSILHGMSVETVSFFMSYLGKVVALSSRVSLKKNATVSHPFVKNVRRIHQQPRREGLQPRRQPRWNKDAWTASNVWNSAERGTKSEDSSYYPSNWQLPICLVYHHGNSSWVPFIKNKYFIFHEIVVFTKGCFLNNTVSCDEMEFPWGFHIVILQSVEVCVCVSWISIGLAVDAVEFSAAHAGISYSWHHKSIPAIPHLQVWFHQSNF